jgi:hypothetical protein
VLINVSEFGDVIDHLVS